VERHAENCPFRSCEAFLVLCFTLIEGSETSHPKHGSGSRLICC
jgi:hypothetical protein